MTRRFYVQAAADGCRTCRICGERIPRGTKFVGVYAGRFPPRSVSRPSLRVLGPNTSCRRDVRAPGHGAAAMSNPKFVTRELRATSGIRALPSEDRAASRIRAVGAGRTGVARYPSPCHTVMIEGGRGRGPPLVHHLRGEHPPPHHARGRAVDPGVRNFDSRYGCRRLVCHLQESSDDSLFHFRVPRWDLSIPAELVGEQSHFSIGRFFRPFEQDVGPLKLGESPELLDVSVRQKLFGDPLHNMTRR